MGRRTPDTTEEWLEYYREKYQKSYNNYQQSGITKYDTEAHKYSVIVDAFEALTERGRLRKSNAADRMARAEEVIDGLYKSEYSRSEVADLLRRAAM